MFKPMGKIYWPKDQNLWGASGAFASIMQRVRVFVIQGNQHGQEWGDPALVRTYPQNRAQVLEALVPVLTEGLRTAYSANKEDQVVVHVVQKEPIELFVAMGPYRATVREDRGLDGSIWIVLTQFTKQMSKEMQVAATFGPHIQGDAGDLHALLSALHTRLLRLEQ